MTKLVSDMTVKTMNLPSNLGEHCWASDINVSPFDAVVNKLVQEGSCCAGTSESTRACIAKCGISEQSVAILVELHNEHHKPVELVSAKAFFNIASCSATIGRRHTRS